MYPAERPRLVSCSGLRDHGGVNSTKNQTGRRRWTSRQRQRLLALYHESKLTQRAFANQYCVGLSTLVKWLRLERDAAPKKVKFQEVRLPEPTGQIEVVSPQGWIAFKGSQACVAKPPGVSTVAPCHGVDPA